MSSEDVSMSRDTKPSTTTVRGSSRHVGRGFARGSTDAMRGECGPAVWAAEVAHNAFQPYRSRMKRPRYAMPADIEQALERGRLIEVYQQRPSYQQNDYVGWITRARGEDTRQKRLAQMLAELEKGGVY